MKVKIVYRNYKNLHTIHSSIVRNPPADVKYITPEIKTFLKKFYPWYCKIRGSKIFAIFFGLFKDFLFSVRSNQKEVDLYHYVQYVPKNLKICKPYVVDFEHVIGLTDFQENEKFFQRKVLPFLENSKCKKIIALSEAAKNTLIDKIGDKDKIVKSKIEVVYPALPLIVNCKKEKNKKMKFLFVGNHVYRKGLHEVLEAFKNIPENLAELTVISEVPNELIEKYTKDNIKYLSPKFSHEEILREYFCKSDVFVMPTHRDTFGMVFLDALSTGTPVISTKQFAIPELIEEGKTGFLIDINKQYLIDKPFYTNEVEKEFKHYDENLIEELRRKILYCIEHPDLIKKMGQNAKKLFEENGKFSIQKRNKILKRIYEEALEIH